MAKNNLKGVHTISNAREKLKDFLVKVTRSHTPVWEPIPAGIPSINLD